MPSMLYNGKRKKLQIVELFRNWMVILMYNFEGVENIYFRRTKEYFQEVISSYSIGNYRSATVMLYSVVICDMLYKLQELKDMYNDTVATQILAFVETSRSARGNGSRSSWEKEFVEKIHNETELLDLEDYTNINHLYDNRNFSAHPALNDNYELIQPSKETTAANIINALKIFVKPPIFIKKVIDLLVEDLENMKDLYDHNQDNLKPYLYNRYYSRMSETMKLSTIKTLWKFCFCKPDDLRCVNNRSINRHALELLIEMIPKEANDYIKDNPLVFNVSQDDGCIRSLVMLLAKYPVIYQSLDSNPQLVIDRFVENEDAAKFLAWFKYSLFENHIAYLKSVDYLQSNKICSDIMIDHYTSIGLLDEVLDFYVELYGDSYNYDTADKRFSDLIEPNLQRMKERHFIKLIEMTNENQQVYGRGRSRSANNTIIRIAKEILPSDFDYTVYGNFLFSEWIVSPPEGEDNVL